MIAEVQKLLSLHKKQVIMKLTDNSPMPFGTHKGTKMANVPAKYLLWIYEQNLDVMNYIKENMEVLQKEVNKRK